MIDPLERRLDRCLGPEQAHPAQEPVHGPSLPPRVRDLVRDRASKRRRTHARIAVTVLLAIGAAALVARVGSSRTDPAPRSAQPATADAPRQPDRARPPDAALSRFSLIKLRGTDPSFAAPAGSWPGSPTVSMSAGGTPHHRLRAGDHLNDAMVADMLRLTEPDAAPTSQRIIDPGPG